MLFFVGAHPTHAAFRDAGAFNGDVSLWDVSSVTSMFYSKLCLICL